jgi:hypothetical protein
VSPEYTGISITPAARDDLRRFQAQATGVLAQRVNMSDALRLAVRIATAHLATDGTDTWKSMTVTKPNGAEE